MLQHSAKPVSISSHSILIVAPHPDDEIIGLGGLIIQKVSEKADVNIVFLTDGECSGASSNQEETKQARVSLSEKIARQLGIPQENLHRIHLPDANVPHRGEPGFTEAVAKLTRLIDQIKPSAIFATHFLDHWPFDHVACSQIATEAVIQFSKSDINSDPQPGSSSEKQPNKKPELWLYWVWAWYYFRPWKLHLLNFKNLRRLEISNQLHQKRELMDTYLKPTSPEGKPWSGVLPPAMIYPFSKPIEVIERIYY